MISNQEKQLQYLADNLTVDEIEKLSEQEIFLLLNHHFGRETGPVTATTRSLYCSLLKNIFLGKENLLTSENDNFDTSFEVKKRIFDQNCPAFSKSTPLSLNTKQQNKPQSNFFTKSLIIGFIIVIVTLFLMHVWLN